MWRAPHRPWSRKVLPFAVVFTMLYIIGHRPGEIKLRRDNARLEQHGDRWRSQQVYMSPDVSNDTSNYGTHVNGIDVFEHLKITALRSPHEEFIKTTPREILKMNSTEMSKWRKFTEFVPTFELKEFNPVMGPKNKMILYQILDKLRQTCDLLDIVCFMYGGTLLGSWRHHDVIPWDGDADVLTNATEKDELFSALSMSSTYKIINTGTRFKLYSKHGSQVPKHSWTWPYVDIWFFQENKTHIWDDVSKIAFMREYVYPKDIIFPLHFRPFGGTVFLAPKDSFTALQITYKSIYCESGYYNYKLEQTEVEKFKEIPCEQLRNDTGFVFRESHRDRILEKLIIGNYTIHSVLVNEPVYAISDPFKLSLTQ